MGGDQPHPRFDPGKEERLAHELLPSLVELASAARSRGVGLTIDAEEQDRLDLTLDLPLRRLGDTRLRGDYQFQNNQLQLLAGLPSLSIPCFAERRYGGVLDDEMLMALPPDYLAKAITGINAMPPKGTCADCSDDELKGAIQKMSGLK